MNQSPLGDHGATCATHLLSWMSHTKEGSTDQWDRAARSLLTSDEDSDEHAFRHTIRRRLQLLGHADFNGKRWRVLPPCLLLRHDASLFENKAKSVASAFLAGARTPEWEKAVTKAAKEAKVKCESLPHSFAPPCCLLTGSSTALESVAAALGIPLVAGAATRRLGYVPFSARHLTSPASPLPSVRHWRYYDMETLGWHDLPTNASEAPSCDHYPAALLARPEYGAWRYFVAVGPEQAIETSDAGSAVLAAAGGRGKTLCNYEPAHSWFIAPVDFPLEAARALCLCSGSSPRRLSGDSRRRVYENVPESIASVLLERFAPPVQPKAVAAPPVRWLQHKAF